MRSVKCVIVGDGAVGKTSLLISYTTNSFPQDYIPTVFDNYSTTIAVPDPQSSNGEQQLFKLNLWDTAGQEEYDRLRPLSYPQTDIFLICFSVNEPVSFINVSEKWFPEIRHNTNYENMELFLECGKYPILLVGTKADLRDDEHEEDRLREMNTDFVSQLEIDRIVHQCGFMGYVECSAATQEGIREVFERAIDCVVYKPERLINKNKKHSMSNSSKLPLGNNYSGQHEHLIDIKAKNAKFDNSHTSNNGFHNSLGIDAGSSREVGRYGNNKQQNGNSDKSKKMKRRKLRCIIL